MASWLMRMGSFMVLNMPLACSGDKPVRYAYHAFPDGVATYHFAGRTGFGLKTIGTLSSTITVIAA